MALSNNNLQLSIVPNTPNTSLITCVVGHQSTFKIKFSNTNLTDAIYNICLTLSFPDGISFVSASTLEYSNIINSSFSNVISFVNIKDLAPNESEFTISVTVKIDSTYRSNGAPLSYNHTFSNISISCTGDSMPRGSYDVGNTQIQSTVISSMKSLRYSAKVTLVQKALKGAGSAAGADDATNPFQVAIEIQNTSLESSNISFSLTLANGIRYLNDWLSSGSSAVNFSTPVVTLPTSSNNSTTINLNNKVIIANGVLTLTFNVGIWNYFTLNGLENSGSLIANNTALISNLSLSGSSSSFYTEFMTTAINFNVSHYCVTLFTDAYTTNEYILTISASEYSNLNNVFFYFLIPDGMSYVANSSTVVPDSITTVGTSTLLTWDYNTVLANTDNFIKLYTITNEYYTLVPPNTVLAPVYATDTFTTSLEASYVIAQSGETADDFSYYTLTCSAPSLTTEVTAYLYANSTVKPYNVAAIGDYVRFTITYDASALHCQQKDVVIFDYPPINLDVASVRNITITGISPVGISYTTIPDNGVRVPLGTLPPATLFTFSFELLVGPVDTDTFIYNLAKCFLNNSNLVAYSLRDSTSVEYGFPHLEITQDYSTNSCLTLNDAITHTLVIANTIDSTIDFLTDGFNIDMLVTVPNVYSIVDSSLIATNAVYTGFDFSQNIISLDIQKLPPYDTITIVSHFLVDTTPIMGKSYTLNASITNGTSQQDPTSYSYTFNPFPLNSATNRSGCTPTIFKSYTPNIVKLREEFDVAVTVTFPAGCLAFNTKIKDSLISTNSSNVNTIRLNGTPVIPSISTNNLVLPLNDMLDTSSGSVTYTLTYKDKALSATPVNYIQQLQTLSSIDWSEVLFSPEIYSSTYLSTLSIVVPALKTIKSQSNTTDSFSFDTDPIFCDKDDIIAYKVSVANLGLSPAYDVFIVDTLPHALSYINNDYGGTFNLASNVLTCTIPEIPVAETVDIIINSKVKTLPNSTGSNNSAYTSFKENSFADMRNLTTISNSVTLYPSLSMNILTKYQRNASNEESFTRNTTRCLLNQVLEYKLVISNTTNSNLIDIIIEDTFPNKFIFLDTDPFSSGTITLNTNVLNITIPTLNANSSIELIYRVKLTSTTIGIESSIATCTFKYDNNVNVFTDSSNPLFVRLADLGRGFLFY